MSTERGVLSMALFTIEANVFHPRRNAGFQMMNTAMAHVARARVCIAFADTV